ncbi:DUF86 domain-containing protein [Mucilaginibacter sp. McL0603]|uniref:HepT-like ribonuclease domain-containing protein n=1 Tax=Mucilaginibacter sp. McL0603 TaxID=3415670 RepID=UPI003CE812AB
MDRKVKLYVDIVNSINLIDEFLGPINLFEVYTVDLKTKSAIERQLGIIGEAVKKIKDIESVEETENNSKDSADEKRPIPYQSEIIGFRNRLIHGYDMIDDYVIWSILKNYLSPLKEEILTRLEIE